MRSNLIPSVALASSLMFVSGCGDEQRSGDPFASRSEQPSALPQRERPGIQANDDDRKDVENELANLKNGKDVNDAGSMAVYDKAVENLTRRGSRIETTLIDALRSSGDWSVRMGCVDVLQSIGTKASVEHLIQVLDDVQPLVAKRSNSGLEAMTGVRMVVMVGDSATSAAALPAVPKPAADDMDSHAHLRVWEAWHVRHGKALRQAWTDWWKANKATAVIK